MHGAVLSAWQTYPSLCPQRHAEIDQYYSSLIEMLKEDDGVPAYFEGMGNFGGPGLPPAAPHFTVCRLTDAGAALAQLLLKEEPERKVDLLGEKGGSRVNPTDEPAGDP